MEEGRADVSGGQPRGADRGGEEGEEKHDDINQLPARGGVPTPRAYYTPRGHDHF